MNLFPYDTIRQSQEKLVNDVKECLKNKIPLVAHAPTGIGKTAAVLAPALEKALAENLTICFLTSRHTQHLIALRTVKEIQDKHKVNIPCVSLVGKKNLCAHEGMPSLPSEEFIEYCKSLRENGQCAYFSNVRAGNGQVSVLAQHTLSKITYPALPEALVALGKKDMLCPYELALLASAKAKVIVMDYYYLFNPKIRESLLSKLGLKLEQVIVIVDEAHNLPARCRDLLTQRLSTIMMRRAIQEAKKFQHDETLRVLVELQEALNRLTSTMQLGEEKLATKELVASEFSRIEPIPDLVEILEVAADAVKEAQRTSSIGGIAQFIKEWSHGELGYSRILCVEQTARGPVVTLTKRCLDPALLTKEVIENSAGFVLMSGTLTPTELFADVLGLQKCKQQEYLSPFPDHHRLTLAVPRTTTKFAKRTDAQFQEIGRICADMAVKVPGCIAIFFPSYYVLNQARPYVEQCPKTCFVEHPQLSKVEREEMLKRFSAYKETGAVLLGVAAGSFGEGIDLPGVLKAVVVVGLPLDRPDLETKELIAYYDAKFGKGWDYGYILPAITKCLQNVGRCIRSENDRGALIFLDERYIWPQYSRCFPKDWDMVATKEYGKVLDAFFQAQVKM